MAQHHDSAGLITSSADAVSLELYERALASLFRADGRAVQTIDRALARDPAFATGHSLRAGALVLIGNNAAAATLAASIAAIERNADASEREYGYLLGMHAFGLEETGGYDRALALAHRSLELVPDNVSAIHVIAHVLEMRGGGGASADEAVLATP